MSIVDVDPDLALHYAVVDSDTEALIALCGSRPGLVSRRDATGGATDGRWSGSSPLSLAARLGELGGPIQMGAGPMLSPTYIYCVMWG